MCFTPYMLVGKRSTWAVAVVLAAAVVAGCGSSSTGTESSGPAKLKGIVRTPAPSVGTLSLPDVNHGGTPLAMRAAPGGLLLVYFGYTNCPDLCPGTLAGLRLARHQLGAADAERVQVAMATVDPERDTDAVLTEYLGHFFDDAHALRTTDPAQLEAVADAFGVKYEIAKDDQDQTEVGHTALSFAVDDQGRVVDAWPFGMDEKTIANDMRILLARSSGSSSSGVVRLERAWARSTAESATTAAVYLTIVNDSGSTVRIIGATVPASVASDAHVHRTSTGDDGMAGMKMVETVTVKPGTTVRFAPGGYHVMLMGLAKPLTRGEQFPITLSRASGSTLTATVAVRGL